MSETRRLVLAVVVMGVAILLASGVAIAAIIDGTSGPDTLNGTDNADTINGYEGADTITGRGGADTIAGRRGGVTTLRTAQWILLIAAVVLTTLGVYFLSW